MCRVGWTNFYGRGRNYTENLYPITGSPSPYVTLRYLNTYTQKVLFVIRGRRGPGVHVADSCNLGAPLRGCLPTHAVTYARLCVTYVPPLSSVMHLCKWDDGDRVIYSILCAYGSNRGKARARLA